MTGAPTTGWRRRNTRRCIRWGRLVEAPYLAGAAFTAADVMSVFTLTTMRLFRATDLSGYPNILAYLQRVGARPGYQRAMAKAEPGLRPS